MIKLSFCQNDPLYKRIILANNSLVTHILFELQPVIMFSPVANFGDQSLDYHQTRSGQNAQLCNGRINKCEKQREAQN